MDPVTHLAAGALCERLSTRFFQAGARIMLPFCLIAALLPDMDSFVGSGPEDYLLIHRGLTHSLVGIPVQAALLAGLFKLFFRWMEFGRLFLLGLAVIALQVWLDLVTSFGTQLLLPFSDARLDLGSVFIIDPFFTLVLLVGLVLGWVGRSRAWIFGAAGVFWIVAYPLTNFTVRMNLEERYAQLLASRNETFQAVHFEPDAFTPLYWKVIVDKGDAWRVTTIKLFSGEKFPVRTFPKADRKLLHKLGEEASLFRTWEWFSLYPYQIPWQEDGLDDATAVQFSDLRFFSTHPVMQERFSTDQPVFTLVAVLDTEGNLLEWRYLRRGKVRTNRVEP